jgi:hypothetical protein
VPEDVPGIEAGADCPGGSPAEVVTKLTSALFSESNPVPVKYALSLLGMMSARVRLPLVELRSATKTDIASVLADVCGHYTDYVLAPSQEEPTYSPILLADGGERSHASH